MAPESLSKTWPQFLVSTLLIISVLFFGVGLIVLLVGHPSRLGPAIGTMAGSALVFLVSYRFFSKMREEHPAELSPVPTLIVTCFLAGAAAILLSFGMIGLMTGSNRVGLCLALVIIPAAFIALLVWNYLRVRKKYQVKKSLDLNRACD